MGATDDLLCLPAKKYRAVETCFTYENLGVTQQFDSARPYICYSQYPAFYSASFPARWSKFT